MTDCARTHTAHTSACTDTHVQAHTHTHTHSHTHTYTHIHANTHTPTPTGISAAHICLMQLSNSCQSNCTQADICAVCACLHCLDKALCVRACVRVVGISARMQMHVCVCVYICLTACEPFVWTRVGPCVCGCVSVCLGHRPCR